MELPLRQGVYGGWRGLGDANEDFWAGFGVSDAPLQEDITTLQIGGGYVGAPTGIVTVDGSGNIIPYGTPGGQMTGPVPPLSSSQLAQSIVAGTVVLAKSLTGAAGSAAKSCPSGYATPQGACIPVQGMTGQLISGVSNQTLAVVGVGFLFLMMMGGGGGRRR